MTIVLAVKVNGGIVFCYDRAVYNSGCLVEYCDKVQPLAAKNVVMGLAFDNTNWKDQLRKIETTSLQQRGKGDTLQTLNQFVAQETANNLVDPMLSSVSLDISGASLIETKVEYLFGVVQSERYHLLVGGAGREYTGLREVDCAGIGSGMFPFIHQRLVREYEPKMSSMEAVATLKRTINAAQVAARKRKNIKILGFGAGVLTTEGYYPISRSR